MHAKVTMLIAPSHMDASSDSSGFLTGEQAPVDSLHFAVILPVSSWPSV